MAEERVQRRLAAILAADVVAHVVADTDMDREELEGRLRAAATKDLAGYKRPRRYLFPAELPRNALGKLDRSRLSGC